MTVATWVATANGGWNATGTWNTGTVPASSNSGTAVIINTNSVFYNINTVNATNCGPGANYLTVNGTGVLNFNQTTYGALHVNNNTTLANTATINISAANATLNTNNLFVTGGTFLESAGALNVRSAAIFNGGNATFSGGNYNGGGTLTVNGGNVTANGANLTVGALTVNAAGSNFNVAGGIVNVTSADFNLGNAALSAGKFNDSGLLNVSGAAVTANGATITAATLNISTGSFHESSGSVTVNTNLAVTGGTYNQSGGNITVGNASFTGGTDTISAGNFNATTLNVTGTTLNLNGGTLTLSTGAATIGSGGTISFGGGTLAASAGGIADSGTLIGKGAITGAITGKGVAEASGGTLELTSAIGASTGLTYDIAAGSVLQVDGTVGTGDTFTFLSAASGEFTFNNASNFSDTFSGLNVGSSNVTPTSFIYIKDYTVTPSPVTGSGTSGTITLTAAGHTDTLNLTNLTGNTGATWYVDWATVGSGTEIWLSNVVCFAAGTRILTATGERMIDCLLPGDIVLTLSGGELSAQPVKWLGRRRIDLTAHPRPDRVAPVRIQRGAFADNMPHSDLLVSPDHAIFADGKLICARQLINGTTIRQETGLSVVEYFHVELDTHAILLAEGLPAESYLDTGNRGFFANSGEPLVLHPDLTDESDYPVRETASCAPFVTDEGSVQPVWQRLAERAAALGQPVPTLDTTTDAEPRIVAKGRTLRPLYGENGLYIFALPKGATEVRVVSRASAPADARPWLSDDRCLGVAVERIVLRGAQEVHEIPLDHPDLSDGWWAVERDGTAMRRWTNGDAALPLPAHHGATMLEIRASSGGMTYVTDVERDRRAA